MDQKDLDDVVDRARQQMADWPDWKKNILTHSAESTTAPRQFVDNFSADNAPIPIRDQVEIREALNIILQANIEGKLTDEHRNKMREIIVPNSQKSAPDPDYNAENYEECDE